MEALRPGLLDQVRAGTPEIHPLLLMGYCDDPGLQFRAAGNTIKAMFPETPASLPRAPCRTPGKTRIVYVSSDFQAHPVGFQIVQILEQHDRERFEVIAVSTGKDEGSEIRARIMRACDRFHDAQGRTGRQIAEVMRDLEPDIAIDMTGHTFGNSLFAFALRPAPIQAAWLGYPGTTGAPFIDYILADPVVLPLEQQPFYSEAILHLPDTFFPMDMARSIGTAPGRAQAGLPENAFVFCCFNQSWKINPPVFDIWMRLLKAVPDSVLWLKEGRNETLRQEAAARGVAPERLVFAAQASPEMHLARHRLADLFLDTLPYNAHATAADALLAGLPLLTCLGNAFPGRVAASLLTAAGLPELMTASALANETLALALARDPARLTAIRDRLAANRDHAPLFDATRFARNLEATYAVMLEMKR
jgi:predicted O-linked N-acetylglucosamine transferase (SPINDLY family)